MEFAKRVETNGAGEILLTSMDRDGTKAGYNLALTRAIADAISIPVIASGGVGSLDHLVEGVRGRGRVSSSRRLDLPFRDLFRLPRPKRTCSGRHPDEAGRMTLEELDRIISDRARAAPDESWTAKLCPKGPIKAAEKFGEEAIEAVIEAVKNDPERLTSEAADVLFHLLVMLRSRDVSLSDVMEELPGAPPIAIRPDAEKASR